MISNYSKYALIPMQLIHIIVVYCSKNDIESEGCSIWLIYRAIYKYSLYITVKKNTIFEMHYEMPYKIMKQCCAITYIMKLLCVSESIKTCFVENMVVKQLQFIYNVTQRFCYVTVCGAVEIVFSVL